MALYKVKPGHRAFLKGALRSEGYVHQVEKPFKKLPDWAEEVKAAAKAKATGAKTTGAKATGAKATEAPKVAATGGKAEVSFTEENAVNNTVTL
jgi:hypothetical protein